jgi:DNA-binding response OmpR family regulator
MCKVFENSSPDCNTSDMEHVWSCATYREMPKKLLVVDDDVELVELLCFNLKKAGYSTGTAFNGVQAIMKARSLRPDLILLDLMLPELDGFALCEMLRRDSATKSIPITLLTALSGELVRINGLDSGANDFVPKPFSLKLLARRIES